MIFAGFLQTFPRRAVFDGGRRKGVLWFWQPFCRENGKPVFWPALDVHQMSRSGRSGPLTGRCGTSDSGVPAKIWSWLQPQPLLAHLPIQEVSSRLLFIATFGRGAEHTLFENLLLAAVRATFSHMDMRRAFGVCSTAFKKYGSYCNRSNIFAYGPPRRFQNTTSCILKTWFSLQWEQHFRI